MQLSVLTTLSAFEERKKIHPSLLTLTLFLSYLLIWKHASVTFSQCHLIEWQKQLILKECHRRELISLAFYTLSGASNCLLLLSLLLFVIFPSRAGWHVCPYWKEQINSLHCLKWPTKPKNKKCRSLRNSFCLIAPLMRASGINVFSQTCPIIKCHLW